MNIFSEEGWMEILNSIVANDLANELRLFQNNHVPLQTDTEADYVEADFGGYPGGQILSWGSSFINGAGQGEILAVQMSWTKSGAAPSNTIYGIYVVNTGGLLVYAERFPAPVLMASIGDNILYNARATLINQ